MISPVAGDAYYFDPDDEGNPHLWIVLAVYRPQVLSDDLATIVSICSMQRAAKVRGGRRIGKGWAFADTSNRRDSPEICG